MILIAHTCTTPSLPPSFLQPPLEKPPEHKKPGPPPVQSQPAKPSGKPV